VIAPINVDRLPGDKLGHIHCQDGHSNADIIDRHEAVKGSLRLRLGHEFVEVGDS
jgi:hypothetical protein